MGDLRLPSRTQAKGRARTSTEHVGALWPQRFFLHDANRPNLKRHHPRAPIDHSKHGEHGLAVDLLGQQNVFDVDLFCFDHFHELSPVSQVHRLKPLARLLVSFGKTDVVDVNHRYNVPSVQDV